MLLHLLLFACQGSKDTGITDSANSDAPPEGCLALSPDIEIGTGEMSFETLTAGDPVTMVHGPQGGWHLLGSLKFINLKQIVEIDFDVFDEASGVQIVQNHYRAAMLLDGDCSGYYVGMFGYINVSGLQDGELDTPPELLGGHDLRMSFHVTDCSDLMVTNGECTKENRYASKDIIVTAALDPIDVVQEDTGN